MIQTGGVSRSGSVGPCPLAASSALPRCAKANAGLMNNAGSAGRLLLTFSLLVPPGGGGGGSAAGPGRDSAAADVCCC